MTQESGAEAERIKARIAELEAKNAAAEGWGAAVGARLEEIKALKRQLRVLDRRTPSPAHEQMRVRSLLEALRDNDLDEPIADNGMTVGDGLKAQAAAILASTPQTSSPAHEQMREALRAAHPLLCRAVSMYHSGPHRADWEARRDVVLAMIDAAVSPAPQPAPDSASPGMEKVREAAEKRVVDLIHGGEGFSASDLVEAVLASTPHPAPDSAPPQASPAHEQMREALRAAHPLLCHAMSMYHSGPHRAEWEARRDVVLAMIDAAVSPAPQPAPDSASPGMEKVRSLILRAQGAIGSKHLQAADALLEDALASLPTSPADRVKAKPVAWRYRSTAPGGDQSWLVTTFPDDTKTLERMRMEVQPLYASPPPKPGLDPATVEACAEWLDDYGRHDLAVAIRALLSKEPTP